VTRLARIARDLCLIGVGIIIAIATPPSVQEAGLSGALGYVWAALIGLGALASLIGVLAHRFTTEIYGCASVGAGFAVWAFAAVDRPDANLTSWALALVFLSGTAGQFYRIGMVAEGRVAR
jgi:hypothetical protein